MKNKWNSICGYCISISAILMILITVVDMTCFNSNFYKKEYEKYGTAETVGVSSEDLMATTNTLLDYLHGDVEDIVVTINVRGNTKEAFNDRETMHMVDVKGLYDGILTIRLFSLLILVGGFLYLVIRLKQSALSFVAVRFLKTALCFTLLIGFLGAYAYVDFNGFWTSFHLLFFRNDLWLLNPLTDFMITMFPEELFFDLVVRIVFFFLIPYLLSIFLCWIYLMRERQHMKKTIDTKEIV